MKKNFCLKFAGPYFSCTGFYDGLKQNVGGIEAGRIIYLELQRKTTINTFYGASVFLESKLLRID